MKNYIPIKPDGMWGSTTASGKKYHWAEDIARLVQHYGLVWDAMDDLARKVCSYNLITREGYIRKNLAIDHNIQLDTDEVSKYYKIKLSTRETSAQTY